MKTNLKQITQLLIVAGSLAITANFFLPKTQTVLAQQNNNRNPIAICHRTDSQSNPYVKETVDQDSVDGDSGNDNGQGDHYLEHTGPVWYSGIADHSWGDIIPSINGVHNGLNWNAQGQAIYNNNCDPISEVTPTPTTDPGDPTITPTPTQDPGTPTPTPTCNPGSSIVNGVCAHPQPQNDPFAGQGSNNGGQVQSAVSTSGQVLGASTLGSTGVFTDSFFNILGIVGSATAALTYKKRK